MMAHSENGVPLVDLTRQNADLEGRLEQAVCGVLASGTYILGPEVAAFESEMAGYIGVEHAVGVASGTDALYLILRALGVGPGDEVVTTDFTYIATADTIALCGATPVFADIDPHTFNMDPSDAERRVTDRTKAIIAVHLYGQAADMGALSEIVTTKGLLLVEDCAQALGSKCDGRKVGSFGNASALSFFPTKNLGCAGDGGMVCTGDEEIARRVRMLRAHGSVKKYLHEDIGLNSRLDELQAALLRVKLDHLNRWNRERRQIAALYGKNLRGVAVPSVAPGVTHVFHQYTVRTDRRDALVEALKSSNVGSSIYYQIPLHLQPCFSSLGYVTGDFPESERASEEVLSLPIFPGMTREEILHVCEAVNKAF